MMQGFASLGPHIALGLGAVGAMLLAPRRPVLARQMAASAFGLALALLLLRWTAPEYGSALLHDDALARLGKLLALASGWACLVMLRPALPSREAPALALLATLGALVLCEAVHAASLFLGMELVTLSLLALIVLPRDALALEAGYKFLIVGAAGAASLLFGLALAYAGTGSLDLSAWSSPQAVVGLGAALLLAGIGFKFALVPFHAWTPDVFAAAPPGGAALAGVVSKIGMVVLLLRLDAAAPPEPIWSLGLGVMGSASILLGNLLALRQEQLARMLGYSSIAHSGYLAVALACGAPPAVLFYIAAYAPALLAALCLAAWIGPSTCRDDLAGLVWHTPVAGLAFALAMLSLAGLPVAAGFFGKVLVFTALIAAGQWGALAAALMGSALGLYVYLRFIAVAFRRVPAAVLPRRMPVADRIVLATTAFLTAAFGLYPQPLIEAVRAALP